MGFTNCLRCVAHVEARVSSIGPMCLPGDLHDFHHAVAADVGCEKRLRSTPPGVYCLFTSVSMSEKNQTHMIIDYIDYCISFIIISVLIIYRL